MRITAALARAPHQPFTIDEVELEAPRDDEILVRIAGVGLCHTDLIARDQFVPIPLPAILGHEGSGVVEQVGAGVRRLKPGDQVVLSIDSCGHCPRCGEHLPTYCHSFPLLNLTGARGDGSLSATLNGEPISSRFFGQSSFGTYALATERNAVKVASRTPLELLGPLGCGVQTGVGAIMRSLACPAGSSLAIFGAGAVGLSAVMGGKIQGCSSIIVVEPIAARRAMALEFGATHIVDPAAGPITDAIRAILPQGVDYAFETSGREAVIEAALASLGSHGMLGLVGVPSSPESSFPVNIGTAITFGHQIKGIIEGDSDLETFIPEMVRLHEEGRLPFDRMIKTFKLTEINEAIAAHERGECIKAVLIP